MNNLKNWLLTTFICLFVVGQHFAQPVPGNGAKCPVPIPSLAVENIYYDSNEVVYNGSDYSIFDRAWLQRRINKNSLPLPSINDLSCPPGAWEYAAGVKRGVRECEDLFEHGKDYDLRMRVICKGSLYYSDIVTFDYMEQSDRLYSEISEVNVEFYPQPASDFMFVKNKSDAKIHSVTIFNTNSQMLIKTKNEHELTEFKIEVSDLSTGLYTAKIKLDDQSEYFKKIMIHSN